MQIKIIIEHKYYSFYQKQICNYREERRESFGIYFYRSREKHQISRSYPRLRVIGKNKHWWARD